MREFFSAIGSRASEVAITLGIGFLKSLGQSAICSFWSVVVAAVIHMENEWREQGAGEVRKHDVIEKATQVLADKGIGNRLTRRWVRKYLDKFLDEALLELNGKLGHNWVERVDESRKIIMAKIPFFN